MYELWGKLIVDSRHSHVAHHKYTEKVIREMTDEFPHKSNHDFGGRLYEEWAEKWLGVPVSSGLMKKGAFIVGEEQ